MKSVVIVVTLASAIAAVCKAATPTPLPESLLACVKIADPSERVRCYDTQIAAITQRGAPTASTPAVVAPRTAAPATPPAPTPNAPAIASAPAAALPPAPTPGPPPKQFGDEQLPIKSRATPKPQEEVLLSSITEVRTVGQKIYLISLANGQVWRQDGSQLPALFRVGNEVRIEKGSFGSYHLSAVALGEKNWVLVTRTK